MNTTSLLLILVLGLSIPAATADRAEDQPLCRMIPVPGGEFKRGDGKTVAVSPFSLASTEVTWSQYALVRDWALQNGYELSPCMGQEDRPVQNVTWFDAVKWCNALSEMLGKRPVYYEDAKHGNVYRRGRVGLDAAHVDWQADGFRLPTEAEWEYAYRAGTTTKYYWGDHPRWEPVNHEYAAFHVWGRDEIDGGPIPVGRKKPNPWGFHDMAGNVEEWVFDRFVPGYEGVGTRDPRGAAQGPWRVLRGGGFQIDRAFGATARHPSYPWWIMCDIGFRTASSDLKADISLLADLPTLPPTPNDLSPYSETLTIVDKRPDTDEAALKRLLPFLDLSHPNLAEMKKAINAADATAALTALRDLLVPRLRASGLTPVHANNAVARVADPWVEIYREGRDIRWFGPDADQSSVWGIGVEPHLSRCWIRTGDRDYRDAYFWMLNQASLYVKPTWNRLSIAEKSSRGNPPKNFHSVIGFDAGSGMNPLKDIAWMLSHKPEGQTTDVPPRVLANYLYSAIVDRLAAGIQDARDNVPNQIWGNATGLIEIGHLLPEFKDSEEWLELGVARARQAAGTVMPDGTDLEASVNYNGGLFRHMAKLNELFEEEPEWLEELNRLTRYRHYMFASLITPFASMAQIGNKNGEITRPRKNLKERLESGNIEGMERPARIVLAETEEEERALPKPAFTSVAFPYGGYYILRSGWGGNDDWLHMRASRMGYGHHHHDNNGIQLAANGEWLLIDSGSPAYGPRHLPDHQKKYAGYFGEGGIGNVFQTNALSVDGLVQQQPLPFLAHPTDGYQTPIDQLYHHSDRFDLVEGIFDGFYAAPEPQSENRIRALIETHGAEEVADVVAYNKTLRDRGPIKRRVHHRRLVVYNRLDGFWILVDDVEGGHEYTQSWNFPPPDSGLNKDRYDCNGFTPNQVRSDVDDKQIVTISNRRANIAILNFLPGPVRYRQHYGQFLPLKGWHSLGISGERIPAVQMEGSWRGDVPMLTVLQPLPTRTGHANGLEKYRDTSEDGVSGFNWTSGNGVTVRAAVSDEARTLDLGPVIAEATFLLVRYDENKDELTGTVVDCDVLRINGEQIELNSKHAEFRMSKGGKPQITPISVPSGFAWKPGEDGQLRPVYDGDR